MSTQERAIVDLLGCGHLRKGLQLLTSNGLWNSSDPRVITELERLVGGDMEELRRLRETHLSDERNSATWLSVSTQEVRQALHRMDNGSGADILGNWGKYQGFFCRQKAFVAERYLSHETTAILRGLASFMEDIINEKVGPFASHLLNANRLIPLRKSIITAAEQAALVDLKGHIRPIGVGNLFLKQACHVAYGKLEISVIDAMLQPTNSALSPNGIGRLSACKQLALEQILIIVQNARASLVSPHTLGDTEGPLACTLNIDNENAFNLLDRGHALPRLLGMPELSPIHGLIRLTLLGDSRFYISKNGDPLKHCIRTSRGTLQGNLLSGLIYALATRQDQQVVSDDVRAADPYSYSSGYHDDTSHSVTRIHAAIAGLRRAHVHALDTGQRLNYSKSNIVIHCTRAEYDAIDFARLDNLVSAATDGESISWVFGGCKSLGVFHGPINNDTLPLVRAVIQKKVDQAVADLVAIERASFISVKMRLRLIRQCVVSKVSHVFGNHRPDVVAPFASAFDERIRQAFFAVTNIDPTETLQSDNATVIGADDIEFMMRILPHSERHANFYLASVGSALDFSRPFNKPRHACHQTLPFETWSQPEAIGVSDLPCINAAVQTTTFLRQNMPSLEQLLPCMADPIALAQFPADYQPSANYSESHNYLRLASYFSSPRLEGKRLDGSVPSNMQGFLPRLNSARANARRLLYVVNRPTEADRARVLSSLARGSDAWMHSNEDLVELLMSDAVTRASLRLILGIDAFPGCRTSRCTCGALCTNQHLLVCNRDIPLQVHRNNGIDARVSMWVARHDYLKSTFAELCASLGQSVSLELNMKPHPSSTHRNRDATVKADVVVHGQRSDTVVDMIVTFSGSQGVAADAVNIRAQCARTPGWQAEKMSRMKDRHYEAVEQKPPIVEK